MYKKVIVFEGIDGSGKTFHLNQFLKIREPGGTKNSETIRNIILNKKSTLKKKTDLLLYLAARNENYENLIKPNFNKKIILIDRFTDSTMAYQHYGFDINKKIIRDLNNYILGNFKPNFNFFNFVQPKYIKKNI